MKTRERIVQSSLDLFNQQGERSVSTNHIANYLDISPGNLYYHFANKQEIVAALFRKYEGRVDSFLCLPEGRPATIEDLRGYLRELISVTWDYRFFYRDLEHLLNSDPELAKQFRVFCARCLVQARAIYRGFSKAGILEIGEIEIDSLSINAWILLTSWVRFLCTSQMPSNHLSEEAVKRGIFQVLILIKGFASPSCRLEMEALCADFYVPLQLPAEPLH